MYRPPIGPRPRPIFEPPTWRGIAAGYLLVAAIPSMLWAASHPLAAVVGLSALVGLGLVTRRVSRLVRCFRRCGGFAFELGGRVRVTIAQPAIDEAA